ncbi:MBL fold metallo-hydrolase [Acetobacterium wieringae]|uniref:MBL fold metallo-hydrolase n=1 Tax=Acetobacterium wieringae TaxID=52694 RepID=A0ABY6HBB8_9FIRM|nr:MBL fold metallo-hydrolase [Acetobacterium wieringae]UYO61780.1 MBL fold metallo-hydrolase [Acetobacterium wieringae]
MRKSIKKLSVLLMSLLLIGGLIPASVLADAEPSVSYTTHVQNVGWQNYVNGGAMSGTEGKSYRLEGIKIKLDNQGYDLGISYQTHIQNIGWEADTSRGWKSNGIMSGTSGLGYRLEAIQIKLTGADASKFDVYYQVHAQNIGWMGWAKNGESAGTAGFGYRLEGINIVIVPAGSAAPGSTEKPFVKNTPTYGKLKVSFIDVGQADAILVQQGDASMLIDAGNNDDATLVKNYITNQGISVLDYVIGTHPHEDHIGGLDYVINSFQIGKIFMPEVTATTQTFKDVITAITNKGMSISKPVIGETFKLGDATCTILGPMGADDSDLNTYSIVLKVDFNNNSFLFTGDAEAVNESAMINSGRDLNVDVLKVGHHGSTSSTTQAFLDATSPSYAVICVGAGNSYGHPAASTITRLQNDGAKIFRTDQSGTVVATSDGTNISFNVNPTNPDPVTPPPTPPPTPTPDPTPPPVDPIDYTVYKTTTGSKYHRDGCSYLSKSKIPILKSVAIAQGLTPCSKCNP